MRIAPVLVAAILTAAHTSAQSAPSIGWRIAKLENPTKQGEKVLNAVVHYPAKVGSKRPRNAALAAGKTIFPVIVFLHGYGASGGMMVSIGQHFAEHGYVVVLTNTTRKDRKKQAINASAFFDALEKVNKDKESFFAGRLDMKRVGISGHSMGGGNTLRVLAKDNPGYKAGFCFAPWTTRGAGEDEYIARFTKNVDVPLAIVHGVKDKVLPWKENAVRLYDAVKKDKAFRSFWVLGDKATHVNIAVPSMLRRASDPTFQLCSGMATAFFDRFLKGKKKALDRFLDPKKKPKGVEALHMNATQGAEKTDGESAKERKSA